MLDIERAWASNPPSSARLTRNLFSDNKDTILAHVKEKHYGELGGGRGAFDLLDAPFRYPVVRAADTVEADAARSAF